MSLAWRIDVVPWRFTISTCSSTPCAACSVKGTRRSFAASKLSRSSVSVQFSICIGDTTPESIPEACFGSPSMKASAASRPLRPRASSQSKPSEWSSESFQRASAKPGARNPRMPLLPTMSAQPS